MFSGNFESSLRRLNGLTGRRQPVDWTVLKPTKQKPAAFSFSRTAEYSNYNCCTFEQRYLITLFDTYSPSPQRVYLFQFIRLRSGEKTKREI